MYTCVVNLSVPANETSTIVTYFSNNGLNTLQDISFISNLHAQMKTISGSVQCLATNNLCGVYFGAVDEQLLYDCTLWVLYFFKSCWRTKSSIGLGKIRMIIMLSVTLYFTNISINVIYKKALSWYRYFYSFPKVHATSLHSFQYQCHVAYNGCLHDTYHIFHWIYK